LNFALKTVDEWNALAEKFGRDGSRRLVGRALAIVDAFSTEDRDDPAVFEHFATELAAFTTEEIQFLLAKALQLALPELVYVTQVIHDPAHRPADMRAARRRIEAANSVTFVDYAERMALPLWTEEGVQGRAELELKKALGNQVTVFPYGGHLGNLWYPDNKELVLRILGATSNSAQERPGVR